VQLAWMVYLEGLDDGYLEERRKVMWSWVFIVIVMKDVLLANFDWDMVMRGKERRQGCCVDYPRGVAEGMRDDSCVS
jgi:hypothetical protein